MEYLAFALKYRPQNFDDVIGQEHVVTSLKNAIIKERIHHAYLFSGLRGVGKTSLARILAKALNCAGGPTPKPCGKCPSCAEITKGTSLDVIEIDGASNRGIDEIRALREAVKLSPSRSRYKIYIIDEVHMLTQEAFNALLKTLEEPPSHVKFVFATTHPQKVLPTILSRCQKFQFNLLTVEKIMEKLETIVRKEKLDIDKSILHSIAHSAQGSIRDAESLLDQVTPIVLEKADPTDIISFLGIIDEESLNKMVKFMVEKNITESLDFIQKISMEGADLGLFLNSLIEHLRNILLAKVSPQTFRQLKYVSPSAKKFIANLSGLITTQQVLEAIDLLIEAKDLSRKLHSVRIPLELAMIKFSSDNIKDESPPQDERKNDELQAADLGINDDNTAKDNAKDRIDLDIDDIDDIETGNEPRTAKEKPAPREERKHDTSLSLKEVADKWPQTISEIGKTRVSLASYLREATLYSLEEGTLKLAFPSKLSFHKEIVESVKNLKFIENRLVKYLGKDLGIKCILLKDEKNSLVVDKKYEYTEGFDKENNFINELLDTFEGKIHTEDA